MGLQNIVSSYYHPLITHQKTIFGLGHFKILPFELVSFGSAEIAVEIGNKISTAHISGTPRFIFLALGKLDMLSKNLQDRTNANSC